MPATRPCDAIGAPPATRRRGELAHLRDQALGGADAAGRHHQPLEPEPLARVKHAVAFRADQVGGGHADVIERDDRVVVADRVRCRRACGRRTRRGSAGRRGRAGARRRSRGAPFGIIGLLGLEEAVVGGVERGHVPLHAVEHPGVAVAAGGRRDRVDVGARALLGDRVALLALAADRGQQVALELVGGGDRREPGRGRGGDPAERVGHPADLLLDEDLLERGAAAAAELARQVGREDAELDRALLVRGGDVVGQAAGQLGLDLERDELVGEGAGARLDVLVCC